MLECKAPGKSRVISGNPRQTAAPPITVRSPRLAQRFLITRGTVTRREMHLTPDLNGVTHAYTLTRLHTRGPRVCLHLAHLIVAFECDSTFYWFIFLCFGVKFKLRVNFLMAIYMSNHAFLMPHFYICSFFLVLMMFRFILPF